MKFLIKRASGEEEEKGFPIPVTEVGRDLFDFPVWGCEISTLEELLNLAEQCGFSEECGGWSKTVIVSTIAGSVRYTPLKGFVGKIVIYDDYLE